MFNLKNKTLTTLNVAITAAFASPLSSLAGGGIGLVYDHTITFENGIDKTWTENVNEGLQVKSTAGSDVDFTVKGDTNLSITTSESTVNGIRISGSSNQKTKVNASFDRVKIQAIAQNRDKNIAVGIWTYGDFNGVSDPNGSAPESSLTVKSDLTVDVQGTYKTYGVVAGSTFGNNSEVGGNINLYGDNTINIDQKSDKTVTDSGKAIGLLAFGGNISATNGSSNISVISNRAIDDINNVIAGIASDTYATDKPESIEVPGSIEVNNTEIHVTHTSSASYNTIYGIETNLYGSFNAKEHSSKVQLHGTTSITLKPNTKTTVYGIASFAGQVNADGLVQIDLDTSQRSIGGFHKFYGVSSGVGFSTTQNSSVNLLQGLVINLPENERPGQDTINALRAENDFLGTGDSNKKSTIVVDSGNNTVQIEGNLYANSNGTISLSMNGAYSYVTGWANNNREDSGEGTINLKITKGAVWNVISRITTNNHKLSGNMVDSIDLNGGIIDMTYATVNNKTDWEDSNHRQILVIKGANPDSGKFTGNNGTIQMDMDLFNEGRPDQDPWLSDNLNLDQIDVRGTAEGTHNVKINFTSDLAKVDPSKVHSENWLIHQKSGVMTLNGSSAANGGMQGWSLKFFHDTSELPSTLTAADNATNKSDNTEGYWYLVRNSAPTPEENTNINVGTSTGQALAWAAELEDLRLRLGEVRYGSQDGAWAKASFTKDRADGLNGHGFTQHTNAIHVGLDRLTATTETSSWLLGGALRYGRSTQEGLAAANGGNGDLNQYSGKLYATWMHESGSYADLVAQLGYYTQDLDGLANDDKTRFSAKYHTWGAGASVEVGHMFTLAQDKEADDRLWYSHWFLEPQAQLSYFAVKGADYTTSTGMQVSQENADFLTGRLGFVLGKKVNYGGLDDLDKRYFQAALMGGVKYEFLGDQGINFTGSDGVRRHVEATDMSGARYYYGVMADWQASDNLRFYGQVSREEGSSYTREYALNFGVKYQF